MSIIEALIPLVAVISIFVILPGMSMYFADRKRRWAQDQTGIVSKDHSGLMMLAERMEKRIESLEKILDVEAPEWRSKYRES